MLNICLNTLMHFWQKASFLKKDVKNKSFGYFAIE